MCINLSFNILGQQQQRTVNANPPGTTGDINDQITTILIRQSFGRQIETAL